MSLKLWFKTTLCKFSKYLLFCFTKEKVIQVWNDIRKCLLLAALSL